MSRGPVKVVGIVAALALLAGCGSQRAQTSTSHTGAQLSSSTPASTSQHSNLANSAPGSRVTRLCTVRQLTITMHGVAGLGHVGDVLDFHNRGTQCMLYGYPGADGLDRQGLPVVSARRTPRGYLGGLGQRVPEKAVLLNPGQTASALLEGLASSTPPAPCRHYTSLEVTPPGETRSVRFAVAGAICSPQIHPVVPGTTGREL